MASEANRQLWRERIQQWRASGLTQKAFAKANGYHSRQVSYWNAQFKDDQNNVELVPVIIKGTAQKIPSASISLHSPTGWQLHLPAHCSSAWVGELLQRLR